MPDFAVGAKFIYRDYGRVIEDFLCVDDGHLLHRQPGRGDHERRLHPRLRARVCRRRRPSASSRASSSTPPSASRTTGTVLASYLYSTLEGNYDGVFAPFTQPRGRRPEHLGGLRLLRLLHRRPRVTCGAAIHQHGSLSNDRRHQSQGLRHLRDAVQALARARRPTTAPARRSPASASPTPTAAGVLPRRDAAREGRTPSTLRGRPPPRLSAPARSRDDQVPGRRLQRPQRAAGPRGRPAVQPRRVHRPNFDPTTYVCGSNLSPDNEAGLQSDLRTGHRPDAADLGAVCAEGGF